MLTSIQDWFEKNFVVVAKEESDEVSLQKAAAVLLCEIMHADHDVDSVEQATILDAMQTFLEMSAKSAKILYDEIEVLMKDALSIQQFTSLLNEQYNEEKKLILLRWLWRVVYADGRMDAHEEHLVRRISDLLYVRHSDYIRIRNLVCGEAENS